MTWFLPQWNGHHATPKVLNCTFESCRWNFIGEKIMMKGVTAGMVGMMYRLGVHESFIGHCDRGDALKEIAERQSRTGSEYIVMFGKYTGKRLADIPQKYVDWAFVNIPYEQLKDNIARMRLYQSEAGETPNV